MPKTKISEFSSTPANNTDIDSINIAEGCAASGINDAIRELMAQLKDFQTGAVGDSFNGPVGTTTPAAGAFTTLSATGNVTLGDASTDTLNVGNGGLIKDASGNLGLGVTPSAWISAFKAMEFASAGSVSAISDELGVNSNSVYLSGTNWTYKATGFASQYRQSNSSHRWYTAPSGTAGNAITFTQAMTLDASGNLMVGATSAVGRFTLEGSSTTVETTLRSTGGVGINNRARIIAGYQSGGSDYGGYLAFNTTSSSNVNNEAARIDSSGNLLVGTTGTISGTNAAKQVVYNNTASQTCFQAVAGSSHTGVYALGAFSTVQSSSGSNVALVVQSGNGSTVNANNFFVYTNGNVTNTNNSYGAISDVKLKENIVDATPKLANLMQVKVRNYNLIGQTTKQLGVVAQELETVFPAMVDETADRDTEGNDLGTTTKSVKYSVFVPMLIKAIQELKAEFDAYKASHP